MDNKSSHIKCTQFNIEGHFISLWSGYFDQLNFHVLKILARIKKKIKMSLFLDILLYILLLVGDMGNTQQFTQENFFSYIAKYFK